MTSQPFPWGEKWRLVSELHVSASSGCFCTHFYNFITFLCGAAVCFFEFRNGGKNVLDQIVPKTQMTSGHY